MKPLRCCAIGDESKKWIILQFTVCPESCDVEAVLVDKDGMLSSGPIRNFKIIDPDLANIVFNLTPPEQLPYYSEEELREKQYTRADKAPLYNQLAAAPPPSLVDQAQDAMNRIRERRRERRQLEEAIRAASPDAVEDEAYGESKDVTD